MATISLKVALVDQNTTKTIQFTGNSTVNECCKEIREKIGDKTTGPNDHGMFSLLLNKWLAPNKTLDFYDMNSGDAVEYKKKHRPLRIRLMDDTQKTVLIDDSNTVVEIVATVCTRIGISNPDEYSLQTDPNSDSGSSAPSSGPSGKLSRKGHHDLHDNVNGTGEEGRWLNPEKTFSEQGVVDSDILILKKKFFFSDQNIDRNDPIQLNLLFVQARDAIISGKHPCKYDEAAQLAALQCQIQFSNHEPDKHKPGFIKLKDFVPPEYIKEKKEMEKKIFQEHRKLQGLSELNAKFRYVQLCRSLKTYGVTFFLVKEKVDKKNKIVPRLLGVTRDSVMRLDAETKEIVKVWPLTTLRRWAASPNSFTLDFGDYAEAYYSVQTSEGEQISQLIAGYIDIILKKRKEATRAAEEEEEQVAIAEETLRPAKASTINVMSNRSGRAMEVNVASAGVVMDEENQLGGHGAKQMIKKKQFAQTADYGTDEYANHGAQQALLQNISNGFASVNAAQTDLAVALQLPPIGNDPASQQWRNQTIDVNKQSAASQVGAHLAATCSIINIAATPDAENMDFATFGTNVAAMSANVTSIASSAKMVAALMDVQQGDKLLDVARSLAAQTSKFLQTVQPAIMGDGFADPKIKSDLLGEAQELSRIGHQLLFRLGEMEVSQTTQEELVALAKAVVSATVALVSQGAKPVASESAAMNLPAVQKELVTLAKQTASAAETLVTTTMVAAPAVNMTLVQDQLLQGTLHVKDAIDGMLLASGPVKERVGGDAKIMADLARLAGRVNEAMAKLVARAKNYKDANGEDENQDYNRNFDALMAGIEHMLQDTSTSASIVSGAREVTVAATQMVNYLKQQGQIAPNQSEKDKILNMARPLAEATSKMVVIAKDVARTPNDAGKQEKLHLAVEDMEKAALGTATKDVVRKKLLEQLVDAAKAVSSASTQLVTAGKAVAPSNRNQASQMQLNQSMKNTNDAVGGLISATRAHAREPDDTTAQMKLVSAAKQSVAPLMAVVAASKVAASTTRDEMAQQTLTNSAQQMSDAVAKMSRLTAQVEDASSGVELNNAMETVQAVKADIEDSTKQAAAGTLRPLYYQTPDSCLLEVNAANKVLGTTVAQLNVAAPQRNENLTGVAAVDIANALQAWVTGLKGLAATSSKDASLQKSLLDAANRLANIFGNMIDAAKLLAEKEDRAKQASLESQLKQLTEDSKTVIADVSQLMPGTRDLDHATSVIIAGLDLLENGPKVTSGGTSGENFQISQNRLNAAAAALAQAANALVAASRTGNPGDLKTGANSFEDQFNKFVTAAQAVLAQTTDENLKAEVVSHVKSVGESSLSMLASAKSSAGDPTAHNFRNALNLATMGMANSIGKLIEACTVSAPGTSECNQADQKLMLANGKLDTVLDPSMTDRTESYFDCLRAVAESTKNASTGLSSMNAAAKTGDGMRIGTILLDAAKEISALADASARAAYLIGISDPSSTPAIAGILDPSSIKASAAAVIAAVKKLADPKNAQKQILEAAGAIAKNTAILCNVCKQASQNPKISAVGKQQFVTCAKNIATSTASLVGSIKVLAAAPSDETRNSCKASAAPLTEAVEALLTFSESPELAPTPASISPVAMTRVAPILETNRRAITLAQDTVGSAKSMCSGNIDPMSIQLLGSQIKSIADALKQLSNLVKNNAPGQKDCDESLEKITASVNELDTAMVQNDMNSLTVDDAAAGNVGSASGDQGYRDALLDNAQALLSLIPMICQAAKGKHGGSDQGASNQGALSAGQLGAAAQQFSANFQPTTTTAIRLASSTEDKNLRKKVLDTIKEVGESGLSMLFAAKMSGGDSAASEAHTKLDEERARLEAALGVAIETLEGSTQGTKELSKTAEVIQKQMRGIPLDATTVQYLESIPGDNYQVYAQEILATGKTFVGLLGDIMTKTAKPTPETIKPFVDSIGKSYAAMSTSAQKASSMTTDPAVRQNLLDAARELGGMSLKMIDSLKAALISASGNDNGQIDPAARQKVGNSTREMSQGVNKMLSVAKEGSKGIVVCEQAIESIADIVVDLESQIMFAQANQLDPIDSKDSFANYKDPLQALAKDFVDQAKQFVTAAASSNQDNLSQCATTTIQTITALKDTSKKAAASITSKDASTQEQLLMATKSIAEMLSNLIQAAMACSGKPVSFSATGTITSAMVTGEIGELRNSAKSMVLQVQEYIKVIKLVGDESSRGLRAVDVAIKDITHATNALTDGSPAEGSALPEDVATTAKSLATAAAQIVSVSSRGVNNNNQDDLVNAANDVKKVVVDLVRLGKSATDKAPDEKKSQMYDAINRMSAAANMLLDQVKAGLEDSSADQKSQLQAAAKAIADSVSGVVDAVGTLIPGGYVDPNDPNVIAERELLAAAASIEAAARKLAMLKPPERPREANEDLNFEEQILEAAKAIAAATGALVRSATTAQREIVAKGRKEDSKDKKAAYFNDGTWSDGLVSAAKQVAYATGDLCEAANAAVKGEVQRERVVAAAKGVSSSTAQLMSAAAVQADPNSQAQTRLRAAGKSVTHATEQLVKAAQESMAFEEAESVSSMMKDAGTGSVASQRAKELDAQAKVLQMEKELEMARGRLSGLRKGKYNK